MSAPEPVKPRPGDGLPGPGGAAPAGVLVTRPQPQADDWVASLRQLGQPAQALPLLAIGEPADPGAVAEAWATLHTRALVMFVSPSAVERFFRQRPPASPGSTSGSSSGWPPGVWAGSTGPGTARALRQAGVPDEAVVSPPEAQGAFDSEALWRCLQPRRDWRGTSVLIVRGEGGRDWLAETLRAAGATVFFVEAYRRDAPQLDGPSRSLLHEARRAPGAWVWLFSSSEAVQHLPALAPGADWSSAQALATHPRIAAAARAVGFGQVWLVAPSPQAVVQALRGGPQT